MLTAPLHLHHVGIAVRDIPEASIAYTDRLGYVPHSGVIHDPEQTANVQFFRLSGDPVLVELVSPAGPASKLSAAVAKGGGLHHLCYATDDIDRACQELQLLGLTVIHRPTPAVAFGGRRIAWLAGRDRMLTELVERGADGDL